MKDRFAPKTLIIWKIYCFTSYWPEELIIYTFQLPRLVSLTAPRKFFLSKLQFHQSSLILPILLQPFYAYSLVLDVLQLFKCQVNQFSNNSFHYKEYLYIEGLCCITKLFLKGTQSTRIGNHIFFRGGGCCLAVNELRCMVGRELGLNLEINLQYFHIRGIFYLNNKFVFIVFHKKIVGKKKCQTQSFYL